MKNVRLVAGCCIFSSLLTLSGAQGAAFDSGSTGLDGPLNVTSNMTLSLPPDGIFNFTTITVAAGKTLTFNRNALNTPVYLLAASNVVIAGAIDVSGKPPQGVMGGQGGPGGFDGGYGGSGLNNIAGDGYGPGGGKGNGGRGSFGTNYGNALLVPLVGGSGGAGLNGNPNTGGSGGGGAVLIASNGRITVNGVIYSLGGDFSIASCYDPTAYGGGSGGAIRLVAPIVDGTGVLQTRGGFYRRSNDGFCDNGNAYAGSGRVRIDCLDRNAFASITYAGTASRGSQMFVFPPAAPRLDIIEAAGTAIPEGTGQLVSVELPVGSSTNQVVRVQARNFTNDVPISVVVTPDHGPSRTFSTNISLASGNPPVAAVNVTIPAGTVNRINAWTR